MPSLQRLVIVLALGSTALLTACAPDTHLLTPTTTSPATETPAAEGTFDPETDPVNPTVGVDCRTLIDDQTLYDWGSGNFGLDVTYQPAPGSSASTVVSEGGLACSWVNLTSSETVNVAVAIPTAAVLAEAEAAAVASGEPAPLISVPAYFSAANGVGHVDAFSNGYWITADSTWFYSSEDAALLINAAVAALG